MSFDTVVQKLADDVVLQNIPLDLIEQFEADEDRQTAMMLMCLSRLDRIETMLKRLM